LACTAALEGASDSTAPRRHGLPAAVRHGVLVDFHRYVMRVMALDMGTKRVGVAVSDELGIAASGVATLERSDDEGLLAALRELIKLYRPERIVLGVPYDEEGRLRGRGRWIVRFGRMLEQAVGVPVVHWDESFSTREADQVLIEAALGRKRRKRVRDKVAASLILSGYLRALEAGEKE